LSREGSRACKQAEPKFFSFSGKNILFFPITPLTRRIFLKEKSGYYVWFLYLKAAFVLFIDLTPFFFFTHLK
jgi:hypothetical protein